MNQCNDYPKAGPGKYAKFAKPAGQWNELEWDITEGVAVVKRNGEVIEKSMEDRRQYWPRSRLAERTRRF